VSAAPYILFIASWYPNPEDETLGIFIRRHAEAVALFYSVKVLYMQRSTENRIEKRVDGNIEEYIVHYRNMIPKVSMYSEFLKAAEELFTDEPPMIVHAHVTLPAGFLARVFAGKVHVPYVITEHWTGYHPQDGCYKGFLTKMFTKAAISKCSCVMPVSADLGSSMRRHGLESRYKVVPNVADPIYFNTPSKPVKKKFIHISSLDEKQKNISGLFQAFSSLQKEFHDVELLVAGDGKDRLAAQKLASDLHLRNVTFTGNLYAEQLAEHLTESLALVLFSNFENLPCVIIEAFACGTPVISTNVGGVKEIVNKDNGILIRKGDINALKVAMKQCLEKQVFDRSKIRTYAQDNFSYETVGKMIVDTYTSVMQ
jgi:L-malate glycosyltransferase